VNAFPLAYVCFNPGVNSKAVIQSPRTASALLSLLKPKTLESFLYLRHVLSSVPLVSSHLRKQVDQHSAACASHVQGRAAVGGALKRLRNLLVERGVIVEGAQLQEQQLAVQVRDARVDRRSRAAPPPLRLQLGAGSGVVDIVALNL
jgi:hypothetical protein